MGFVSGKDLVGRDVGGKDLLFGLEMGSRLKGGRGLDEGIGLGGFFTRGSGTIGRGEVSKSPKEGMVIGKGNLGKVVVDNVFLEIRFSLSVLGTAREGVLCCLGGTWNLFRSIFPILLSIFEADGERGKGVTEEGGNGEM